MNPRVSIVWMSAAGVVGAIFGVFYAFFGLEGFPAYHLLIPSSVFSAWGNGLYGAVFVGFSALLFFVGRHAFKTGDKVLMKALLYGINSWLVIEALFSIYYGVYFNVAVDVALSAFLSFPLLRGIWSNH
jgi:hypothetical protein